MARPKKTAPVETPKEFDLFQADVTCSPEEAPAIEAKEPAEEITEVVVTIDEAIKEAILAEDKEWKCTAECPHYTRASKECQECWEKGHAL